MELDLTGFVLPERVEELERSEDERSARFSIAPLERGFGQTLGNSVRRILLSSLPGAAVWAFRMDGVLHEHQTVEGVVEDVHQIIQNLKSLVLALDEGVTETTLELRASKAGAVTAEAFDASGVSIINPSHHLFTLQEDREVNLTLYVNQGRGWVQADQHELPKGSPVDMVRIDAIYNPVLRANFTVEETRVGQRTDFDRLTLHVEMNGSMDPERAIAYAAELARLHLSYLLRFSEGEAGEEPPVPGATRMTSSMQDLLSRPIDELAEFSVRSVNSLKKENIVTLADLVRRTEDEMLDIENFGAKSLEEIRQFLQEHDLRFGLQIEEGEDGELYVVESDAEAEVGEAAEEEE